MEKSENNGMNKLENNSRPIIVFFFKLYVNLPNKGAKSYGIVVTSN